MGSGRRRFLLAIAAATSSGSAWLAFACSPTAPQSFLPDVNLPQFDSAPPLAYEGGPEPVRVAVASAYGPVVGATVVFHDANGKAIGSTLTDGAGHVERSMPAGAAVSILFGNEATTLQAVTYLGVEPGDLLVAFDRSIVLNNNAGVIQDLPTPPPKGATAFSAFSGGCSTSFTQVPATVPLALPCLGPTGHFPVLVEAFDPGSTDLGFTFVKDQTLDFDAGAAVSMATAKWSGAPSTWTASLTNQTALTPQPQLVFSEVASLVPLSNTNFPQPDPDGGFLPAQWAVHPGYPDFVQTEVRASGFGPVGSTFSVVATRSATPTANGKVTLDLSRLPPQINTLTFDYTTAPSQPTLTYKPDAPFPSPVGVYAVFTWSNFPDGGALTNNSWTIIAPPTMTTITAPELPASASAWTPVTMVSANTPEVVMLSGDGFKSYSDFRRAAAAIPPPNYNGLPLAIAPMLPVDGTLIVSSVGPFLE